MVHPRLRFSFLTATAALVASSTVAAQAGLEVLPKDRPEYNRPVAGPMEPRPAQTPATGTFFMQDRALPGGAVPDSEVVAPGSSMGIDRDRLYFDEQEGVHWVRGKTYKASISPQGFSYTPFLGSQAPQSYPTRFRLESAAIGERELPLTELGHVTSSHNRVVIDRGAVAVIYDFSTESVEQSFALDVAGSVEDLQLVLDVQTELEAHSPGRGFEFFNDLGGMRYGEAIVLDQAGRSAAVASRLNGSELSLTVPASFLTDASGMVVVDPILDTFSVDTATGFQRDLDVAYDLDTDAFLYVYEDQFSGTDSDVYMTQVSSTGAFEVGIYVESGNADWTQPNVAGLHNSGRALIVATEEEGGMRTVAGRIWDFQTRAFVNDSFTISTPPSSLPKFGADVGGNSTASPGSVFMVVWNIDFGPDSDIQFRAIGAGGQLGTINSIDSSTDDDSTDVVISESTGDPAVVNRWTVAYVNRVLATGEYTIKAAQFNALAALTLGPDDVAAVPSGATIGELDVSDALDFPGVGSVYAVAFDQFSTLEEDTFISFVEGVDNINTVELQRSEHADLSLDQAEARLSTTRDEFVVTYLEENPGTQYQAFITALDFTEGMFLSISERRTPLGEVGSPFVNFYFVGGGAPMASRFSGGLLTSRIVGVGMSEGFDDGMNAAGRTFIASNGFSPAFQYCDGNPNSTGDRGFIRLEGSRSTTSLKSMIASALPLNTFGFFIVGDQFAAVPNPGGSAGVLCVGGTIGRYSNQVTSSGANGEIAVTFDPQSIAQPNGSIPAVSGSFWQFSLWHRDSAGGSATSNFTNAVSILFE